MNLMNCKLCADYRPYHGCGKDVCPWLPERIAADAVSCREVVLEALNIKAEPTARLEALIRGFTGMWRDEAHSLRMRTAREMTASSAEIDDPAHNAALYLLSSSYSLFARVVDCLQSTGIQLERARLNHITSRDFTLYLAAWNILHGDRKTLADRAIQHVTNTTDLALIVNALVIARFGPAAFDLR